MDSLKIRVRILMVFALICLILSVSVIKANPTYTVSALYTDFNSVSWTEHDVPSGNYTVPYTVRVMPYLTLNSTGNPSAQIHFVNITNEVDGELFGISLYKAGVIQVNSGVRTGVVVVATDVYTMEETITIRVQEDGFTVNNGTDTICEYFTTMFSIDGVYVRGVTAYTATAGYVNVEFSDGTEYGLDIINEILPAMVAITVLSSLLGALAVMTKKMRV